MIFTGFVYVVAYLLGSIIAFLPTSTGFPASVASSFTTFAGYVQILNTLLPISTLATVLGIIISVDIAIFTFKTLKWLVSHLPIIGGRG